jgi:hypothetical protein
VPQQPCLPCHELQFNDFEIAGSINVNSHPTSDENFWDDDDFIDSLLYDAIAGGGWSCGIIGDNWETTTTLPTVQEDLEQDSTLHLPPHPPGVSFYTHGSKSKKDGNKTDVGEVKKLLGSAIWQDIKVDLPRVQTNGLLKLHMNDTLTPARSREIMNTCGSKFPHLPLVHPERAEQRAHALKKNNSGVWTPKSTKEALDFFAAEAANMKAFIIYPEVTGRDELLADERYCTPAGGCLCICPSCKVNTHVTPNGINVSNDTAKMRFA